jgi:hypothetical protein
MANGKWPMTVEGYLLNISGASPKGGLWLQVGLLAKHPFGACPTIGGVGAAPTY